MTTEIAVNALTSDQIVNTMQSQKQMAENGQTNGTDYQALKNILLASLSMVDVFDDSFVILPNGTTYKPTLQEWANAVDGAGNLDPNLKVYTKSAKLIGTVDRVLGVTQLVIAVGEDRSMFTADIEAGRIPGNNTLAYISGLGCRKGYDIIYHIAVMHSLNFYWSYRSMHHWSNYSRSFSRVCDGDSIFVCIGKYTYPR
ncbi:hypothetical protein HC766_09610 [Candidatus Gracilibacteria bacterium]|nr:hypothetical protein [Candidatus Gracilibacteria bacterium]